MRELSGARGWEYAYKKALEDKVEVLRDCLETCVSQAGQREDMDVGFLCGQIHGIRESIKELSDVRERFNLDDDEDLRK